MFAQFSVTVCQSNVDALIATDRNEWAHINLPIVNEGYLHNFEPPSLPCGLNNPNLTDVDVSIELISFNNNPGCVGVPIFGNVLLNCPLTTTAVCPIVQDVLSPGCGFGIGSNIVGTYSLSMASCGTFVNINDVVGVDIIPATENLGSCANSASAVSDGVIEVTYQICVTFIYDQDLPNVCDNTIAIACDDGDPCTENDLEFVDVCDNDIVCVPCSGDLIVDCQNTETIDCDDGDPCTINDVQVVSVCDNNFICVPCEGELVIDCNNTIELPCDDGDSCTENDVVIVSACDENLVCEPCQGIEIADCTNIVEIACDDNDPCTENDVLFIDLCNDSTVCIPCAGTVITPLNCDDGNCNNGFEYWDDDLCMCITIPPILGCTDPNSCNFDPSATCDFECDYSCIDCSGVPYGNAILDECGNCLDPNDSFINFSCLSGIYIPNSFSPNGDGRNDYFNISTIVEFESFQIQVFNRIGQVVFASNDPFFKWNGTSDNNDFYYLTDVYVYLISYTDNNGEVENERGHITLLR